MYVIKFLQTNPKRIVIGDRMYDPYNYGGIIPFFCNQIPEEIQYIIDNNLTEDNKKKVTWFINNIIEIDRRCKLIIEIYQNKKLIFRKYF